MSDNECVHGMNPEWCAICLNIKTPEEEQEEIDRGIVRLAERLGRETT